VGLTFFQHGTHKYFNFPPGQSYQGINLATMQGWAGTIELVAGSLILLGLFTDRPRSLPRGKWPSAISRCMRLKACSRREMGAKTLTFLLRFSLPRFCRAGPDQS
jgi:hypothetical protein